MAAQPDNRIAQACGAVGETTAGDRRLGWVIASDLDARRVVIAVRQFVRANTFLLTGGQVVAGSRPVSAIKCPVSGSPHAGIELGNIWDPRVTRDRERSACFCLSYATIAISRSVSLDCGNAAAES
jgi:hypothetical protein